MCLTKETDKGSDWVPRAPGMSPTKAPSGSPTPIPTQAPDGSPTKQVHQDRTGLRGTVVEGHIRLRRFRSGRCDHAGGGRIPTTMATNRCSQRFIMATTKPCWCWQSSRATGHRCQAPDAGTYAAVANVGAIVKTKIFWADLRRRCGNVHFAGTECVSRWAGYMEGTIATGRISGEDVADAVLQASQSAS